MSTNTNRVNNPMKVITGPDTRWSYANVWEPKSINGGTPKYSVSLIIPKSDTVTINKIKAAIEALPIQKTPGVGMVFIAQFLDKSNNRGTYEVVFFNTETKEIIEEWITDGKARGFGLRNYWAGSVYSALKKL